MPPHPPPAASSQFSSVPGAQPPASSLRPFLLLLICVVALSLLEFRAVDLIQSRNLPAEVDAAAGLLSGHPYWKAYQNRLLGPEVVGWTIHLTGLPPASVYRGFCFGCLCAANAVGASLFRRSRTDRGAPLGVMWSPTPGCSWRCKTPSGSTSGTTWTSTTTLLFAWAVVMGGWRPWQFALLFLVELANRESAQFIALWLVLDSLLPGADSVGWGGRWVELPLLGVAVGLGAAGTVWTHFVRSALCLGETGVVPRKEITEFADGQFFMGRVTLDLLHDPWNAAAAVLAVLLAALGFLLWRTRRSLGRRAWKVAALLAVIVAANGCLSFIYELRVWFVLLPFAVCLAYRWRMDEASCGYQTRRAEKRCLAPQTPGRVSAP